MNLGQKISVLKEKINTKYSSFAQTLDSTSKGAAAIQNDFAMSIIHAIRTIGKEVDLWKETILIPVENGKTYYNIPPEFYLADKLSMSKPISVQLLLVSEQTGGFDVYGIDTKDTEDFFSDESLKQIKLTDFMKGDKFGFRISESYSGLTPGTITSIVSKGTGQVTVADNFSLTAKNVFSLRFNKNKPFFSIKSISDKTISTDDDLSLWDTGDVVFICESNPPFIMFTFSVIPKIDWLIQKTQTSFDVDIPIMEQYQDDLDDICLNYLYKTLIQRDPDRVRTYQALISSGLLRMDKDVIRDVKARAHSMSPIVIKSYNPTMQRYGR